MKTSTSILLLLVVVALVGGGILYFRDTTGPEIGLNPSAGAVSASRPLTLTLEDEGSGLKNLKVTVHQKDSSFELLSRDFSQGTKTQSATLELADTDLGEGPFELRVQTADRSIYHFGAGNTAEETYALEYDSRPPVISVLSNAHNLNQGGAGLIVYTISEDVEKSGVEVGERFFPAHLQKDHTWACLFSQPYDVAREDFAPRVVAVDRAGNERRSGFYFHSNARQFPQANINISERFLQAKMPQFENLFPKAGSLLDIFLKVNGELRIRNRATLADVAADTAEQPLWRGAFMRQPGAANREPFGAARTYFYDGRKIDRQRHLGIDLASVAQAPVPVANRGQVASAGFLGIYGNCVIVDHGLGLQTIYAHLSAIDVEKGQEVEKGDILGHTGATGLAGGDHLHFGVIVAGVPVNPVEWWDPTWLKNNIDSKLELIPGS